ncbi:hypothetical protein ACWF9G_30145 [Nocardia sp. NPDC055029]
MKEDKEQFRADSAPISVTINELFQSVEHHLVMDDNGFDLDAGWARLESLIEQEADKDKDDDTSAGEVRRYNSTTEDTTGKLIDFPTPALAEELARRPACMREQRKYARLAVAFAFALATLGFVAFHMVSGSGAGSAMAMLVSAGFVLSIQGLFIALGERSRSRARAQERSDDVEIFPGIYPMLDRISVQRSKRHERNERNERLENLRIQIVAMVGISTTAVGGLLAQRWA